jgi:hypothetical protein
MTRRAIIALLVPVRWAPPGVDLARWREALAEDVVDGIAGLREVQPAIAAGPDDRALAEAVAWPGMPIYDLPVITANAALAAAAAAGHVQAAVIAADAPDVPGLVLGKLLRPLTSRPLALAPAGAGAPGLLGVAAQLPGPAWLPPVDLDTAQVGPIRAAAPRPGDVAVAPGWRRLRGPADLATLDPGLEGWEATRALLTADGPR